jgi:hypothetical protein
MFKSKKVVPLMGVVLIIAILFSIFGTPKYQSIKVKNENFLGLKYKLKEAVNTNTAIDIKKLTDFDWDECYVFPPYYSIEQIYEEVGTEWTICKTFIGFLMFNDIENQTVNEDQYIIVFKKDSKVILSSIYSLNQLPVIFKLDNHMFTSNNSKFIVTIAKQFHDSKIKELILKK